MRALRVVALALSVALVPGSGRAQSPDEPLNDRVERLSAEGTAAYSAGRYAEAAQKFQEAYRLYPDPTLLYNIARSHHGLGQLDQARSGYARFLREPDIDAGLKAKAEAKLKALQSLSTPAAAEAPPQPQSAPPQATTPPDLPRSQRSSLWVWVALGTGVALAAGGATLFALGSRDHQRVEDAPANKLGIRLMTQREADSIVSSGQTKKILGVSLLAVGGGAIATSAALYLLGRRSQAEEARRHAALDFRVGLGPDGGLAVLEGSF